MQNLLLSFPAFMTTCLLINEQKLMKLFIIRGFRFLYQKIGGMQQSEAKVMLVNLWNKYSVPHQIQSFNHYSILRFSVILLSVMELRNKMNKY